MYIYIYIAIEYSTISYNAMGYQIHLLERDLNTGVQQSVVEGVGMLSPQLYHSRVHHSIA